MPSSVDLRSLCYGHYEDLARRRHRRTLLENWPLISATRLSERMWAFLRTHGDGP